MLARVIYDIMENMNGNFEKNKTPRLENAVTVYIAQIPKSGEITPVYPPLRQREILACTSEKVRREKYYAWKLLEYAVSSALGETMQELVFEKSENGKWKCNAFEFSLSHSKNAVALAISQSAVGVDIQLYESRNLQAVAKKVLSEQVLQEYASLSEEEKTPYLLRKWTEKESVFKTLDAPAFFTADFSSFTGKTYARDIVIDGERYCVCVACDRPPVFYDHISL